MLCISVVLAIRLFMRRLEAAFSSDQIAWAFSIFLESVAIVPQLIVVHSYAKENNGFIENLTSDYVFCLGGYRGTSHGCVPDGGHNDHCATHIFLRVTCRVCVFVCAILPHVSQPCTCAIGFTVS